MSDTLTATVLASRDPVRAVREGLTLDDLDAVGRAVLGTSSDRRPLANALGVSTRTLSRRVGGRLSAQESDRLLLLAETFDLATRALDGTPEARAWLAAPHARLGGETPLARMDTLAGTREVQTILLSIEHGLPA